MRLCRVAKIIDLRTSVERAEKPDVTLAATEYIPNPIFDSSVLGISHEKSAEENKKNMRVPAMEDLYRMMVTEESCRANLGRAVKMIMEDYLLTNEVNEPKAEIIYNRMISAGKSEAEAQAVKNTFLAKAAYLEAAFSVIDEQYGGMDSYLRDGLGIADECIAMFRKTVLE